MGIDKKLVGNDKAPSGNTNEESRTKSGQSQNKDVQTHEEHNKNGRKRKRHFYNAIRQQMEFYFGDANLSKDRFLKQLIDKDPYVPLEIFIRFNKIKALTESIEQIAKSLSNSQLLELDETQLKVRRKTALPVDRNVDDKTLYVESLPSTADHEWVRHIFERFGPVTYVSLPRFAISRSIKEFAFVEFEREGCVESAVKAFQEFNGVLSLQESDPSELCSVRAFIKEKQNKPQLTDGAQSETCEKINTIKSKSKKRRKATSDTEDNADCDDAETKHDGPTSKKRLRTELIPEQNIDRIKNSNDGDSAAQSSTAAETDNSEIEHESETNANLIEGKKRRKRKHHHKKECKSKQLIDNLKSEPNCYDLKILPKRDWKRLRNKYLNLQREKIAELKRKMHSNQRPYQQQRYNTQSQDQTKVKYASINSEDADIEDMNDEAVSAKRVRKNSSTGSKLHKMNMNFYGAGGVDAEDSQSNTSTTITPKQPTTPTNVRSANLAQERAPLFTYEPGLIVEVNFMEPCVTIKDFKADMRQYSTVKYVDVSEGAMCANLRLETADAAVELVRQINCAEYKCKVLKGKSETRYWKKIEQDREMKLNKKVKVPQKRGREKIKKMITKHIRFGDDDGMGKVESDVHAE